MRYLTSAMLVAIACALCTSPVLAQEKYRKDGKANSTPKQGEIHAAKYFKCIVRTKGQRQRVLEYVRYDPKAHEFTKDIKRLRNKLIESDCLPDIGSERNIAWMKFSSTLYRYELISALYWREYRDSLPADLSAVRQLDYSREFAGGTVSPTVLALRVFGDCVVRLDSQNSHELVLSELYSKEERRLFGSLQPSMSYCLPKGDKVSFTRPILRGSIAEGLLRLRQAQAKQQAETQTENQQTSLAND